MNQLSLDACVFCESGRKEKNEDAADIKIPEVPYELVNKGIALAVADGVSTAGAGQEASETAIVRFIEEYYKTPDTWSVARSGEKILSTINLRLFRKSHEYTTTNKGYLSTFSSLVLKSKTAHYFHVGDSRIYLFRNGELKQITRDHTVLIADGRNSLSRALGMDSRLHVDYGKIPMELGDVFILSSDGIHDFIPEDKLIEILSLELDSDAAVNQLKATAWNNGSDDNTSAIIAKVSSLPDENLDDYSAQLTRLPFPPNLSEGMKIDGYRIKKELFSSNRSQVYLVEDVELNELYVMKTPSRNFIDDVNYIDRFIQEEWIGSRIESEHVVKTIQQKRTRNYLYYVMEYIEGVSLDKWIAKNQPPNPKKTISLIKQIAKGLKCFHENETIHQDLKPANIIIDKNEKAIIVDFGSVYVAGLAEQHRPLTHDGALGTATYSDPTYLLGNNPGIQGDVYALATIAYEMFCGNLPYGDDIEECQSAMQYDRLRYESAAMYNPVIPIWFDRALQKGVTFDLQERYASIDALLRDLTHPNPEFLKDEPKVVKNTNAVMFWKLVSAFLCVTLVLVIYLFSVQS